MCCRACSRHRSKPGHWGSGPKNFRLGVRIFLEGFRHVGAVRSDIRAKEPAQASSHYICWATHGLRLCFDTFSLKRSTLFQLDPPENH